MFTFIKRPFHILANRINRQPRTKTLTPGKWVADFSKHTDFSNSKKPCFDIKSENSYDANLEKKSLFLGLKKKNCIAWLETAGRYCTDQIIEARFRLDAMEGSAAAGIMFRIIDQNSYYAALVSSKGFFRLDAVQDGIPQPLSGWIEAPGLSEKGTNLTIIARSDKMIFLVNGRWIAEVNDSSFLGGHPGFALASYDQAEHGQNEIEPDNGKKYTCRAWLDYFMLDSRPGIVDQYYKKWNDSADISAESRLRLAETFAALDKPDEALTQIIKAWQRREAAVRSITAIYPEMRGRRELFLAARMSGMLKQWEQAEEYINACLALDSDRMVELTSLPPDSFAGEEAFAEKAKILSMMHKYDELRSFLPQYIERKKNDSTLYALLGNAHWNLNEYEAAAAALGTAFGLDKNNALYAVNAANACEKTGNNDEALRLRLEGGRIFLRQDNYNELGAVIPGLLSVGEENWEAHALAGKWAFGIEDFERAEAELIRSDELRRKLRPCPDADPAASYLRGLLLIYQDKSHQAFQFFEEAARLAPDYGLFRFRFAEISYLLSRDPHDTELAADIEAALALLPDDEDVKQFAQKIADARAKSPPVVSNDAVIPETVSVEQAKEAPVKKAKVSKPAAAKAGTDTTPAPAEKPKTAPVRKAAAKESVKEKTAEPAAEVQKTKPAVKKAAAAKAAVKEAVKQPQRSDEKAPAEKPKAAPVRKAAAKEPVKEKTAEPAAEVQKTKPAVKKAAAAKAAVKEAVKQPQRSDEKVPAEKPKTAATKTAVKKTAAKPKAAVEKTPAKKAAVKTTKPKE